MNQELGKILLWLLVIIWMVLIFFFSSIPNLKPGIDSEGLSTLISKLAHIVEYAVLMWLLIQALYGSTSLSLQQLLQLAFFMAILYAISDEYHQLFVAGREGTFRDVMIDSVGITIIALYFSTRSYRK